MISVWWTFFIVWALLSFAGVVGVFIGWHIGYNQCLEDHEWRPPPEW
jgi:hypothetical protein